MNSGTILITRLLPESETLLDMGLRIGIALVVGFGAQRVLFLLVGRGEAWIERVGRGSIHSRQRARTIGQIFRNLLTVMVVGSVAIYSLGVLGWDVRPLLATAGIAGVALGFGAQTLVRDVIAGIFIIAEDQFGVGDLIEVNGRAATVEELTVRCTTLRDFNGFLHFVPNGEMKVVVNRSRGWNRLAVDVPISPDEDIDRALEAIRKVAAAMSAEPAWRERMLDAVQVWGVEGLSAQDLQVRLVVRAEPGPNVHEAARELRRRLHRGLAEAGIRVGTPREIAITTLGPPAESATGARAS
jgi:moderate conductance mechanosensitive channel